MEWYSGNGWLLLMVDDSQSRSEIMSSWCMCEWRVGGVGSGWECGVWWFGRFFFRAEWMRPASRFIAWRECPSCLSSEGAFEAKSSIIHSYYCLDSNNCPGYSRVTVYSFYAVLHCARSYLSRYSLVFFGMVFHARMIDVANIKSRIGMWYYLHGM